MKISGMVLVGRHEPYLEYCLKSIEKICDEIILFHNDYFAVSGGAPGYYGKKIKRIAQYSVCKDPKEVNFAKWRNQVLDEASGDWIMWLDADEVFAWKDGKEVTKQQIHKLIEQLEVKGVDAVKFLTHHFMYNYFTLDGRSNGEHYSMRLFKNDGRRFKKKVHEYMDLVPEKTGTIWDMMVWHFGHCKGVEELTGKYRERRIKDNPYTGKMSKAELEQYLKSHDILRGRISTIRYDGVLPSVMGLW